MNTITLKSIEGFKENLLSEEKSLFTVSKYVRDTMVFTKWCKGRELSKELVLEYKKELLSKYAPASVNSVLSSLNSFFEYNGCHIYKVKLLRIQKQIFAPEGKELSKAEYERLLLAAQRKENKRLYYLMQTICSTGIRVSELRFITAEAVRTGQAHINCKGKMRVVMLPKKLCRMLASYIREKKITRGPVFITKNGKPLDRSNIWSDMKRLCKSANVSREKVFPHNLRHLFARTFYSLQKDIVRLADILGHSSVNTTRIYTMESGETHRQQIQSLGLLRC